MSQVIDQDDNYIYEILQEKDCIECATLLAHTFTKHNPYELYMKTTYETFYKTALALSKAVLSSNLSVIARYQRTNEIHGVVQCVDTKTFGNEDDPASTPGDEQQKIPILELMHQSEQQYLKEYEKKYGELKANSVAHIFMAGIRPDCAGHGLGTKLNQVLLEHARRRGFKHVVVDTTNPVMCHIYTTKLNGKVFTSINASTWISKNKNGDDYRPLEHFDVDIPFIVIDF